MDRSIMEGNPHRVHRGHDDRRLRRRQRRGLYLRPRGVSAGSRAPAESPSLRAEELGLLGDNILGTRLFTSDLHINRGAGAFVCGEGSALTASIEGKRGMPRVKPPRTVEQGLWAQPTVLNNVETYANVPQIILRGSGWFHSIGTEKSPGTKAFALTGNVVNTRPDRGADGHDAARDHLRHRRRHQGRQEVQGRADRRPRRAAA